LHAGPYSTGLNDPTRPDAPVLWVLAVLSTITVTHRIVYTYQNTKHLAPLR